MRLAVPVLGGLLALLLSACTSTQDKAKEAQAAGEALIASQKPLEIPKPSSEIKVVSSFLMTDENGSAVAVDVQNTTKEPVAGIPILIDVKDARGKTIFKNDTFGLDYALNHVPVIRPGETVTWVNDQVLAAGEPKSVKVTVGQPETEVKGPIPEIATSEPRTNQDPSGVEVEGTVTNQSQLEQRQLILYAVARSGGRVIAAGRGLVKKLRVDASKPSQYNIFFIGNPSGAEIEVTAPPSVLE